MRISDWSSDVCSSDLCRSSRAGAKVPSASLRGSSRNGVQENVVRRLPVEAEGPGGIIELGVLRLVALSRGRRRIRHIQIAIHTQRRSCHRSICRNAQYLSVVEHGIARIPCITDPASRAQPVCQLINYITIQTLGYIHTLPQYTHTKKTNN